MPRQLSTIFLALCGAASTLAACVIPDEPPTNNITERFSIFVQNPSIPAIHNSVMNFRPNGDDMHLVLRPMGQATGDTMYLENGLLHYDIIHAVIDLEYNEADNTTKMFMTSRTYHPVAVFEPVYGCDPDTDELQLRLQLASRLSSPPVQGGQIGVRKAVDTYEFRYSPPGNPLITDEFMPVNMIIFFDGQRSTTPSPTPTATVSATPIGTASDTAVNIPTVSATATTSWTAPTGAATFLAEAGDFQFLWCFAEPDDGSRALSAASTSSDDMTIEKCAAFCSSYPYFGTEWSKECYCAEDISSGEPADLDECDYTCSGDATQLCGGSRRLSLYSNPNWVLPVQPQDIGNFTYAGCVSDSQAQRSLKDVLRDPAMTLEMCARFCYEYEFFGTEYGAECWCGHTLAATAAWVDVNDCSMTCGGDKSHFCGNADRLSLYVAGW